MLFAEGPEWVAEADKWQHVQVSTLNSWFAEHYEREMGYRYSKSLVNITTLTDLMQRHQSPTDLGFISIDCEGEDLNVLKALDLERFRPLLICVESDDNNRRFYAEYLAHKNYKYHEHTPGNTFFVRVDR